MGSRLLCPDIHRYRHLYLPLLNRLTQICVCLEGRHHLYPNPLLDPMAKHLQYPQLHLRHHRYLPLKKWDNLESRKNPGDHLHPNQCRRMLRSRRRLDDLSNHHYRRRRPHCLQCHPYHCLPILRGCRGNHLRRQDDHRHRHHCRCNYRFHRYHYRLAWKMHLLASESRQFLLSLATRHCRHPSLP